MPDLTGLTRAVRTLFQPVHVGESWTLILPQTCEGHKGLSLSQWAASQQRRRRCLFLVILDTFVISWSVDIQLQVAACSNFTEHLFQGLPVTMVTLKPFRLVLCTWPASIPSGAGTCHHRNHFPHLNSGLSDRQGVGGEWLGAPSWEKDIPWPGWQ